MAFKVDESFLEKISIGAVATRSVFGHLTDLGHTPIELERGSMSFKIWKEIKIKRVRVPDILCVKCGKRVESRGKTKLEVTMSHSEASPDRGWDFGLEPDDFVALVKCVKSGVNATDWEALQPIQYISVNSMKTALQQKRVVSEKPKGATEGFEARVTWPSSVASSKGKVTRIDGGKLQYIRDSDGRTITLRLQKKGKKLVPLVKAGGMIKENQIIASVVPVLESFPCEKRVNDQYYLKMLESPSLSDKYAAAKALHFFPSKGIKELLLQKMADTKEHIYIRLEAASSLLKLGEKEAISFFEEVLGADYLENRLEAAIILGETKSDDACELLIDTLHDTEQHPEIRAGAAWSLGELGNDKAIEALVKAFNEVKGNVRAEAARALKIFGDAFSKEIVGFIPKSNEEERAGVAWALSNSGNFRVEDLLPVLTDDEARKWIAWIMGTQKEADYIDQIEQLREKDKEVYFAVTVLWKILSSWISRLDIY